MTHYSVNLKVMDKMKIRPGYGPGCYVVRWMQAETTEVLKLVDGREWSKLPNRRPATYTIEVPYIALVDGPNCVRAVDAELGTAVRYLDLERMRDPTVWAEIHYGTWKL